jgi:hypothetical protein
MNYIAKKKNKKLGAIKPKGIKRITKIIYVYEFIKVL